MAHDPIPDWRLLAPHRPLSPGDDAYVARPTNGGDAIAAWIDAGGSTVLVSGPTGVGKSTELAQAALTLRRTRIACLALLDRFENIRKLDADTLLRLLAATAVKVAHDALQFPISDDLLSATTPPANRQDDKAVRKYFSSSGMNLARAAIAEVERVSQQGRIALVIDGLEKMLPNPTTREIFDALSELPESVDLIVVIPWHAAFGGGTEPILRAGERLHRVAPLDIHGKEGLDAARFLERVLARRLSGTDEVPMELSPLLGVAFQASGGIPRVFLQLIADAGTYARVKRAVAWPEHSDLLDAIADQEDSFRRALLPGDTVAIQRILGTDGRELDLERRIRLLAQGILLERVRDGSVIMEVHPLAAHALGQSRR